MSPSYGPPPGGPSRLGVAEVTVRLGLVLMLLLSLGVAAWLITPSTATPTTREDRARAAAEAAEALIEPALGTPPRADVERADALPEGPTTPDDFTNWARQVAEHTDVPARALRAYGNADMVLRREKPGCGITWVTLAGIGRVESNHGRFGGSRLGEDGRPDPPIIGVALDGSAGVKAIRDTDGGSLDNDKTHDRAVGPMQFIPSTWRRFAVDGDADGRSDPQDIDDSAIAAARYLCVRDRDMSSGKGWWDGLFSYNRSRAYGEKVFGLADAYAKSSHG